VHQESAVSLGDYFMGEGIYSLRIGSVWSSLSQGAAESWSGNTFKTEFGSFLIDIFKVMWDRQEGVFKVTGQP